MITGTSAPAWKRIAPNRLRVFCMRNPNKSEQSVFIVEKQEATQSDQADEQP